MTQEPLPNEFDVIVLGTGVPESILAAACARVGLSVLHLDRNDYYGGLWGSFNLEGIEKWSKHESSNYNEEEITPNIDNLREFVQDGEQLLICDKPPNFVSNAKVTWHVREAEPIPEDTTPVHVPKTEPVENETIESVDEKQEENDSPPLVNSTDLSDKLESLVLPEAPSPSKKKWTKDQIEKDWRRFSLDISPKLLLSRGSLVQLLISSGVSRYAEFKCVNRFLCQIEDKLKEVPCSRADVFQNQEITMIEKRRLMKFLTFCLNYESERDQYEGYENKTFSEFLNSRDMSEQLKTYILHAIAMASTETTTIEGFESVRKFLMSIGRFGNSPFLWTLYGSGELPQCFCRLCAVFGGIYCLRRSVDAWIINKDTNR